MIALLLFFELFLKLIMSKILEK